MFHTECIETYLNLEIHSKSLPIKCPLQECKQQVAESYLRDIVDPKLLEKLERFQLELFVEQNSAFYHFCPSPDCTNVFEWDAVKELSPHQHCPTCSKDVCLECKTQWHVEWTCKDFSKYKEASPGDLTFYTLAKRTKFQQCSQCKFWIQKKEGCDHITCRCGFEFCYRCGGKYRE